VVALFVEGVAAVPAGLELLVGGRRDPAFGPTVVVAIGDLLADHPRVAELDVNPLIVGADRAVAVDTLMILDPVEPCPAVVQHRFTEGEPCETTGGR
jgi:hypothetical protein